MKYHSAIDFEEGIEKLGFKKLDPKQEKYIEYESRFGYIDINDKKFKSNVPKSQFMFVKTVFHEQYGWSVKNKKDTVYIKNNGEITIRKIVDNDQNTKYELKKKLDVVEIPQLTGIIHYRLVKSQELPMEQEDYDDLKTDVVQRNRERVTFEKEGVKLEFTIVNGKFEIEIEFGDKKEGNKFTNEVHKLLNLNIEQMNYYYDYNILSQKKKACDTYKQLLKLNTLKFVGPLPQTLTYNDFQNGILTKVKDEKMKDKAIYSVTEKADGERFLLIITEDGKTQLIPRNIENDKDFRKIKLWPQGNTFKHPDVNIILDGEFVKNNFYVFDLLVMKSIDMRNRDFSERLKELKIYFNYHKGALQTKFNIHLKKFLGMTKSDISIYQHADEIWKHKTQFPYELDGLIFTPVNEPYYNNKIYKWKEINTIDFATDGKQLFIAGSDRNKNYKNFPFQGPHGNGIFYKQEKGGKLVEKRNLIYDDESLPSNTKNGFLSSRININKENAVGEFEYDTTTKSFNLLKIRYDKEFANNISASNQAWESASNPISIETLRNGPSSKEIGVIDFSDMNEYDMEESLNQSESMNKFNFKELQQSFDTPIFANFSPVSPLNSPPVSIPKQAQSFYIPEDILKYENKTNKNNWGVIDDFFSNKTEENGQKKILLANDNSFVHLYLLIDYDIPSYKIIKHYTVEYLIRLLSAK